MPLSADDHVRRLQNSTFSCSLSQWQHFVRYKYLKSHSWGGSTLETPMRGYSAAPLGGNLVVGKFPNHTEELHGPWLTIIFTGDRSRLAMILYAPESVYDYMVKADIAAGTVIVADEEPEPNLDVTTGIVKPSSRLCRGALLELGISTYCNTTKETFSVS